MQMKESGANYLLDPFLFHFLLVMGVLLSVFVSLYVGTEYHDGTLRNKLISGSSRNAVYGSNLWISFLVGTCSVLLAYTAGQAVQIFNQGVLNLGRMMGYSILIIFGTSLAGLYLFNRKDIK